MRISLTRASLAAVRLALACACLACLGCDNLGSDKAHGDGAPGATASPSSPPDAGLAGAGAASSAPAAPAATVAWRGSYESVAGLLYIPADWKDVHWKVKDSDTGLGAGTMTMRVDSKSGRVVGALEGALGPATLHGLVSDGKLTATISRSDPADEGFMGTLAGSLARGHAEGTMNVSLALAGAIRTATFTMTAMAPEDAKATPP